MAVVLSGCRLFACNDLEYFPPDHGSEGDCICMCIFRICFVYVVAVVELPNGEVKYISLYSLTSMSTVYL